MTKSSNQTIRRTATRCAIAILGFAMTVHSHAADSIVSQIANWPELVMLAKERGLDYRVSVAGAEKRDTGALKKVFRITPYTDGAAAEMHSIVLRKLLEKLGDVTFSQTLRSESPTVRTRVIRELDFGFGKQWQKDFPATYALGMHDRRVLRGRQ